MKYIMFEHFSGAPVPIIFPNRVGFLELREGIPYSKIISAGYVQLRQDRIVCHGQAKELDTKSRPEDAEIIREKLSRPEE